MDFIIHITMFMKKTREIYVRRGDRSEIATVIEQNNLILKGMNKTYDSLPSSYNLSDVSFTLLAATFKKETGDDFDLTKDLVSMGFVTEDGIVTNAGLLLCDQGYLKQSKVVCTRWKGIEKGSVEGEQMRRPLSALTRRIRGRFGECVGKRKAIILLKQSGKCW